MVRRNKTRKTQAGGESSSDDDSDYEIGERNLRPQATMSDLDYIHKNVISTEKPVIEPVPVPRHLDKAKKIKDEESSDEESEDEGGRIDLQKESSALRKLLSDSPTVGNDEGENMNDDDEMERFGDMEEDDDGEGGSALPPRTKNEIPYLEEPIQVDSEEALSLLGMLREGTEAETRPLSQEQVAALVPVGEVLYTMPESCAVVVKASEEGNILNEGTILLREGDGMPLGLVHEVFGPVSQPFYLVRLDVVARHEREEKEKEEKEEEEKEEEEEEEKKEEEEGDRKAVERFQKGSKEEPGKAKGRGKSKSKAAGAGAKREQGPLKGAQIREQLASFTKGTRIACLPTHATTEFVSAAVLASIKAASGKGSDASNIYDEELPPEEQEYSDDEAEQAARAAKKRGKKKKDGEGSSSSSSSSGSSGETNVRAHGHVSTVPVPPPPPPPQSAPAGHTHYPYSHLYPQGVGAYPQGYPMQYPHQGYPFYGQPPPPAPMGYYHNQVHAPPHRPPEGHHPSQALPWAGFQQGQGEGRQDPNLSMSFPPHPAPPPRGQPPTYQVKPLLFEGSGMSRNPPR